MKIQDIINLNSAISNPEVKSKHFTIGSLTDLAYLKRKLKDTIQEHIDVQTEVAKEKALIVPVGNGAVQYVAKGEDDESKAHYKEFQEFYDDHQEKEYEVGKINFVTKEEMAGVCEATTVETAIILIQFLMKDMEEKAKPVKTNGQTKEKKLAKV